MILPDLSDVHLETPVECSTWPFGDFHWERLWGCSVLQRAVNGLFLQLPYGFVGQARSSDVCVCVCGGVPISSDQQVADVKLAFLKCNKFLYILCLKTKK